MKKILLLLGLLLTGCSTTWHVSTTGHDPIYDTVLEVPADVQIDTLSVSQLRWKLRTDFRFRYDYAQYALRQPISFDWNNRYVRFNRFNRSTNFWYSNWNYGYSYAPWDRHQMWNDWVWGFPYGGGIGWSYSWNNRRWSSNHWGNTYGWNNYYGWGNGYGWNNYNRYRGTNVSYHRGRRSGVVNTNGRAHAAMIQSIKVKKNRTVNTVNPPRRVITPKPRRVIRNNNTPTIRTKPVRRTRTVIPSVRVNTPTRTTRVVSNRTQPARKVNSRRKN
ncbi:hypothetical protein N9034_00555 [bacterium]|nr:hypothetical protein [bacterium]